MKLACLLLASILVTVLGCRSLAPGSAHRDLHALFEEEWEDRLAEDPLLATGVGVHERDERLPAVSAADHARRAERAERFLARLRAIPVDELDPHDRVSRAVLERQLVDRAAEFHFGAWQVPLDAESGFHTELLRLPDQMPFRTARDYERYVARLAAIPAYFEQQIDALRAGLARGATLPRVVLAGYGATLAPHLVDDAEESVYWAPFERFPAGISGPERARLSAAGRRAILERAVPAYRRLSAFLETEYAPGARATTACADLPDGRAWYEHLVRSFTTLDLAPEDVHRIGLEEVARIRAEMLEVIARTGFEGSFADFLDFLRTDERFYAGSPEELLAEATSIAARMDARLPALFDRLPAKPYAVAPVPAHLAPRYTSGRYVPSPEESPEPALYWVNTYALESRPLYALTALTLHEAVPGHHLQIALAAEGAELPPFRRHSYLSAFGEGWGLYAEWLGVEAGMYADPYADFGRLTYEMWRACRLVVDTGLHALRWSREEAVDYLARHTALSLHEVRTEVDRYISWPGQALSYKIGELTIKRLRREAEEALGERFDVSAFHDAVLENGSVPLDVLEEHVRRWIVACGG